MSSLFSATNLPDGFTGIDIGCGANKRRGFVGVDIAPSSGVDHVMNFETDRLPFGDNSVDHVFSNHAFEHIHSPQNILREIVRVCKPNALVEIWTPYLKSNDAFLLGHFSFYNESIWKHICYEYHDFYFSDAPGRFDWRETKYVLFPQIIERLNANGIRFDFALDHMFNIALEFGVYITVDKNVKHAKSPQYPEVFAGYSRSSIDMNLQQLNELTSKR
jgi:SAM-dependent methyltransferase